MIDGSKTGAVLYAKQMGSLASFYAAVLSLSEVGRDGEHVHLSGGCLDLVVRQIPTPVAAAIHIGDPPSRREDVPIKLVFYVPEADRLRKVVVAHGGSLDAAPKPWLFDDCQVWDAADPEGNVIQFRTPTVV